MARLMERGRKTAGMSPGTVVYIGEKKEAPITIERLDYDEQSVREERVADIRQCKPAEDQQGVTWYNIDGVHDTTLLQSVGEAFGLHPLVLEDIVNTHQRPKIEDFDTYIFMTLKMIIYDREGEEIRPEHVSLVLTKGVVLSFQEDPGDVFDPVRARIRTGRGRIRKLGSDYLAYALIDAIVDHYFEVLEELGDDIEELEEELVRAPTAAVLHRIHALKRELIYLRRAVWPLREAVSVLLRDESDLVQETTRIYLRDLYDHAVQVIDSVETLRDIVSGMLDIYLSSLSHRMNQIMKVLTIMSTIFIPLTFIAGVYGMNFDWMPELRWGWGYPASLMLMWFIAAFLVLLFKRRGWLE